MTSRADQNTARVDELMQRTSQLLADNQVAKALELLRHEPRTDRISNALGVCFLRSGRPEDALKCFKDLVLSPGSVWPRADAADLYKINYAAALLLCGHPAGAKAALSTLKDLKQPAALRLQTAMQTWATQLPWFTRMLWKFGQMEPEDCPIHLEAPVGELS